MRNEFTENQRGSPPRRELISRRTRQCVALICAAAVWFSFNMAGSIQAAQNDVAIQTAPEYVINKSVNSAIGNSTDTVPDPGSNIAMAVVSMLMIGLLGYNLATSGKRGWGWATLCVAGTIVAIAGKLAVSLFREISSANSVADWDSD